MEWLTEAKNVVVAVEILIAALTAAILFCWKVYAKLRKIYAQLTPNGGTSLADTINEIRRHQLIGQTRTQILWEHNNEVGYYECEGPLADDPGACTWANRYLCQLFGLSLAEFVGFGWTAAIESQAERARIHKSWISAVTDEIPYQEEYSIINHKTGQRHRVRTQAWPCKDKKGNILKMFGTLEIVKDAHRTAKS